MRIYYTTVIQRQGIHDADITSCAALIQKLHLSASACCFLLCSDGDALFVERSSKTGTPESKLAQVGYPDVT